MTNPVRLFLLSGACALSVAALASAPAPSDNLMEIVIGNGPHAGTYKLSTSDVMCMHWQRKNLAVVYKEFDASDLNKISTAAINVENPDEAARKSGSVLVAFKSRDGKRGSQYDVSVSRDSADPITLTRNGKSADLAFQGRTKEGFSLRMTAKCTSVEEL